MAARLGIRQLFYQELREGDRRKIRAESNDAQTGGGARDLRISPEAAFAPFFDRLLPITVNRQSKPRGAFTVRSETIRWNWAGRTEMKTLALWPPTNARPGELRIAQIDENFPDAIPTEGGRIFLLLVRNDMGELWGHYVTERDLRNGAFDANLAKPIVECLDRTTKEATVRGYVDFERRQSYCHE